MMWMLLLAEGEGFKPPIPERGIPDFESSAIDHSANLPIKREPKQAGLHLVECEEGQMKFEPSERQRVTLDWLSARKVK